jgi:RNA recognition motif-containing protein
MIKSQKQRPFTAPKAEDSDLEDKLRLFIGGLPQNLDEQQLINYFSFFGRIEDANIIRNKKKGYSKGYGFIKCADDQTRELILASSHTILGKKLDVNLPTSRANSKALKSYTYNRKIYVPGLKPSVTEFELKSYFQQFGRVFKVYLVLDKLSQNEKTFIGYVEFYSEQEREQVLLNTKFHTICGQLLECQRYSPSGWKDIGFSNETSKTKNTENMRTKISKQSNPQKRPGFELNMPTVKRSLLEEKYKTRKNQINLTKIEITNIYGAKENGWRNGIAPRFKSELEDKAQKYVIRKEYWSGENEYCFDFGNYELRYRSSNNKDNRRLE